MAIGWIRGRQLAAVTLWCAATVLPVVRADRPTPRIVVIGALPAPELLRSPALGPGHIRLCLDRLDPAVVCIESPPAWLEAGRGHRDDYAGRVIAAAWAASRGRPLIGVDVVTPPSAGAERRRLAELTRERRRHAAPFVPPSSYHYGHFVAGRVRPGHERFVDHNGVDVARRWRAWLADGLRTGDAAARDADARSAEIGRRILAAVAAHPQGRVVVILNTRLKALVEWRLAAAGHPAAPLLPLIGGGPALTDTAAIDRLLAPQDLVAILGESWDGPLESALPAERVGRLLAQLSAAPAPYGTHWAAYFKARALMLAGLTSEARQQLVRLLVDVPAARFPLPGTRWRHHLTLRQSAHLELGRLADVARERAAARRHYQAVIDGLPRRQWRTAAHHDDLYVGRAGNAVRALTVTRYERR